ncbi:hypothetical protein [Halopseudomonas laoshanensis]|jgi:hypothetical protein|uniref:hypothetical protein n=1 Tax=Halopseudomonas TaxID=2901189 RepID=UPI0037369483
MNIIKKLTLAIALSAVAAFAVAEDGSDRAISGVPDARQPQHVKLDQFQGKAHLKEKKSTIDQQQAK